MRRTCFYANVLTAILLTLPLTAGAAAEMEPSRAISDPVTVCILDLAAICRIYREGITWMVHRI